MKILIKSPPPPLNKLNKLNKINEYKTRKKTVKLQNTEESPSRHKSNLNVNAIMDLKFDIIDNNKIQKNLNAKLDKLYKNIKIDSKFNEELKILLSLATEKTYVKYKTNLCIINIHIDTENKIFTYSIPNKNDLPHDSRMEGIETLFINLIKWCVSKSKYANSNFSLNINTAIFIWVSDRYIWERPNIDRKIPICLYACPRDKNYIIIPDGTFIKQSTTQRYASKGLNWEQQKRLFTHDIKTKKKIFFRGADTTYRIHNIRGYILERLKTETDMTFKKDIIYEFLTKQNYESVAAFKKYKFMLNLPGQYPWSTRLKYLYLGRQFIINIRVFTIQSKVNKQGDKIINGDIEDHYHSFVDYIVSQDKYCINIDMKYHYFSKEDAEAYPQLDYELRNKNEIECERIYYIIKKIYYRYRNKEPSMDTNVKQSYKLINELSTNDIYMYYLQIAMHNQQLGIKHQ